MAKHHSKGVSTQATEGTTVQSSLQYIHMYTQLPSYCPQYPQPASPKNNTDPLPTGI